MIHVCSLARLYDTVDETGARHIVTLLRLTEFVGQWDRATALVAHCFASIHVRLAGLLRG